MLGNYFSTIKYRLTRFQFDTLTVVLLLVGIVVGSYLTMSNVIIPLLSADNSSTNSYEWTFDSSAEYSTSDTDTNTELVEVSSNTARFKVRNYVADAFTLGLFHLDEDSGSVITDSSTTANSGTMISGNLANSTTTVDPVWGEGKFDGNNNSYGAWHLFGFGSLSTTTPWVHGLVSDSSDAVSVTGSHTLEAWVKFDNAITSSSHGNKQIILDKGDYQLSVDNETGKAVYEFVPNVTPSWEQYAGNELNQSWDYDGKLSLSSITKAGSYVYAGTGYSNGDAEVWKWDPSTSNWTWIGSNDIKGSWSDNTYDEIFSMVSYGEDVIIGSGNADGDADVWYYDASTDTSDDADAWEQIGGDSGGSSAGYSWNTLYNTVYALEMNGDDLYVGLGGANGESELWTCDLSVDCTKTSGWSKIAGDSGGTGAGYSWNTGFEAITSIHFIGDQIFVGLGTGNGDADIYTCNTASGCTRTTGWTKIAGDGGAEGSWSTDNARVTEMTHYTDTSGDTILLAGLGYGANDAAIWKCNYTDTSGCTAAGSWSIINDGEATSVWSYADTIWGMEVDDQASTDVVYIGLGISNAEAEVWACDLAGTCDNTTGWTKIGGDGVNSTWTSNYQFAKLYLDGTTLYAGARSATASLPAELWKYESSSWTQIGGNGLFGSWGYYRLEQVVSLTTGRGNLYAGTGSGAGDAQVWEFNSSRWKQVGGQRTLGSWNEDTFEQVTALNSFQGNIYAGLGTTTDDGQVWKYDGSTWTQAGGRIYPAPGVTVTPIPSGWQDADNIEAVYSMTTDEDYLYVGLGNSNDDADIWKYDGSSWTQLINAAQTASANEAIGWDTNDNSNSVYSLLSEGNYLYAGLGGAADESDIWRYDKTAGTWSVLVNAGIATPTNGSWYNVDDIEGVYSMAMYNGELFAGTGASSGDAEVWKWNGITWTQVGGNGASAGYSSWGGSDYEIVQSLAVYNGYLYATLSNQDSDADVWEWNGSTWTQIGGDGKRGGWLTTDNFNSVYDATVYKGKLYAGIGDTNSNEALVYAYGDNTYVESDSALSGTTGWNHIAGVYNATNSTATMYVNGSLQSNSDTSAASPRNTSLGLLIGKGYGTYGVGSNSGYFAGLLDEIRISSTNRSASSLVSTTYSDNSFFSTIQPSTARLTQSIDDWSSFTVTDNGNGTLRYCLSSDGGTTWKYWNGSWSTTDCDQTSNASTESDINDHISSFTAGSGGILWRAVLSGVSGGADRASISSVSIDGTLDQTAPTEPANIVVRETDGSGTVITGGTGATDWYSDQTLYVSWDAVTETGSGLQDYYIIISTDDSADPETEGDATSQATNFTLDPLPDNTSGTYYIRLVAKDNASNRSTIYDEFVYQYDTQAPANPASEDLTVSPSGYTQTNTFTFNWVAPADSGSGVAGYKYKVNSGAWSSLITDTSVVLNDAAEVGGNTFYLKTVDKAGNENSSAISVNFNLAGGGPSPVNNLSVDASPKTENNFTFTWDEPDSYSGGNPLALRYCYTINQEPSADKCTTSNILTGVTSLSGAYATQNSNTLYVIAIDPQDYGGIVTYDDEHWATVSFVANTTAPGLPNNVEVSDISVKSTSNWRLTISWDAPTGGVGTGGYYEVYSSTDDSTFEYLGTATDTAYINTGLSQVTYYYKVSACDKAGSCSALTSSVSELPTGKYTVPAGLSSEPSASEITTKNAIITWSTDRSSDSKVQYGTSSGSYFTSEPSNSEQITDHEISLTNLSPGTTYYFKAKWTDEDGNTGVSDEATFTTSPAPVVTDPKVSTIGLSTVSLTYTVSGASKVRIYYGKTASFGSVSEVSTSTSETSYTTILDELDDGTKYFYKINALDSEGAEYDGSVLTFETLPRPKISAVKIQQIIGTAQSTVLVSWNTNTEVSSVLTYFPQGETSQARDQVNVTLKKGEHRMVLKGLLANTTYSVVVSGTDKAGNKAVSEPQKFSTSTDTRPPLITELKVAGTNVKSGDQILSQLTVSWTTDEPATSQVEFGEGTGASYSQKTQEDGSPNVNHTVVITGLSPSKVYHLRAVSKDVNGNVSNSVDNVVITPKATNDALNLVISNLQQVFGFIKI